MKNLLLCMTFFCACLLSGCKDEEEPAAGSLYLYSTEASVNADAGSHSVTVFSTAAWQAEAEPWITVDPGAADSKGIFAVRLNYKENTTGAERSGRVVFRAGTYTEVFTLTQAK